MRIAFVALICALQGSASTWAAPAAAFEDPKSIPASSLQPTVLLGGPGWTVNPSVTMHYFNCRYTVTSPFGTFNPHCDAEFYEVIQDIQAIAVMKKIAGSKVFLDSLGKSVVAPLQVVGKVVEHPVDALGALPMNLYGAGKSTAERVKEQLSFTPQSKYEDSVPMEVLGFSDAKRELAARLGVDPYSSNKVLQGELNKLAFAAYGGQMSIQGLLSMVPAAALAVGVAGLNMPAEMTSRVVDNSVTELRVLDRKDLAALGIPKASSDKFFRTPIYSPLRATLLVDALNRMAGVEGLTEYLNEATKAEKQVDAIFYQKTAQMMSYYHQAIRPLKKIVILFDIPVGITMDGRLVALLEYDYVWWTPRAQQVAMTLRSYPLPGGAKAPCEVWVSGRFSPLARQQLIAMGVTPFPQAVQQLARIRR